MSVTFRLCHAGKDDKSPPRNRVGSQSKRSKEIIEGQAWQKQGLSPNLWREYLDTHNVSLRRKLYGCPEKEALETKIYVKIYKKMKGVTEFDTLCLIKWVVCHDVERL